MGFQIRRATEKDVDAIAWIKTSVWADSSRNMDLIRQAVLNDSHVTLVAEIDNGLSALSTGSRPYQVKV